MALKTEDVSLNGAGVAVHHPLDPLTAGEITEVTRVLQDHFQWGPNLRVETIDINEPAKDVVRHYDPKNAAARVARFNVYQHGVLGVWQGLVDLDSAKVISKTFREKARPMLAVQEILDIEATVKADARFQEALRRRGLLAELEYICVDDRRLQHPHRARATGAQLLYLDADVSPRQLLCPPRRGAARAD
jgi:primary-amine oxidase